MIASIGLCVQSLLLVCKSTWENQVASVVSDTKIGGKLEVLI